MEKFIQSALAAVLTLSVTHAIAAPTHDMPAPPDQEKCYGIAKKGMNDCGGGANACSGSAKINNQPDAYLFMPKGLCEKIVGGSLKPLVSTKKS